MAEGATFASLETIINGIKTVGTWFFGLFTDFVNMIGTNSLLLYTVILAIAIGVIGLLYKVVKGFGIKSRG